MHDTIDGEIYRFHISKRCHRTRFAAEFLALLLYMETPYPVVWARIKDEISSRCHASDIAIAAPNNLKGR